MNELGQYAPIVFLPDLMAKEHGIPPLQAGNIILFYGVSNTVGRLTGGIMASYMENSTLLLVAVCMLFKGISCFGIASSSYYWQFVILICMHGICVGIFKVLRTISLVAMFGVASLNDTNGIVMFGNGCSSLLGPPMVGWLKVYWGTYYYAFVVTAAIYIVGGFLALILVSENKKDKYHMTCDKIGEGVTKK
jgi:predicted MFS family arabinose efflux permease